MAYRIRVLTNPDGTVAWVLHPAMKDVTRPPGTADDAWAQQCLDKTMAKHPEWQALTATEMFDTDLPATKAKRAGWRLVGGAIVEDDTVFQAARTTDERRLFDGQRLLKAAVLWQAQLHGKTAQQARDEILAIYRGLP